MSKLSFGDQIDPDANPIKSPIELSFASKLLILRKTALLAVWYSAERRKLDPDVHKSPISYTSLRIPYN